jgi:hypothetical protein
LKLLKSYLSPNSHAFYSLPATELAISNPSTTSKPSKQQQEKSRGKSDGPVNSKY